MNTRQKNILSIVNDKNIVTLQELVLICGVSEATIRRDLAYLEDKNFIYRTHGGAAKRSSTRGVESTFDSKKGEYVLDKQNVAKYVSDNVIANGQTIYLDVGTSTYDMIDYLKDKKITVVTNSVYHLRKLSAFKIYTIILGGIVKHSTQAVVGAFALEQLSKYSFDACFIGCNGIDHNFGISTADEQEAYLKKQALSNSKKKYILADVSKFGYRKFQKFADLDDATIISYTVPDDFKNYYNIIEIKKEDN
ncbi:MULTISPECIES: DeoR/GlpR family DNA-binding transcription regulator [unclassified Gemella]|uniref:DeoR/GlpR family DNA-binding transcription regulator n=1 Tax=unclassified Gemella TaxID=2624949 RepID=UPI001C54F896|nr:MULTISPECIES: DeoR/GlpR family DNA-binding transcription regulator [unclassified Gemella]